MRRQFRTNSFLLIGVLLSAIAACTSSETTASTDLPITTSMSASTSSAIESPTRHFAADIWADNWFSLYINGKLVGEDSVPITTERSFNADTIEFDATYPLTVAMAAKDFRENNTGLEYIGTDRQQMGDGGVIAQITDTSTGEVVAVTGEDWLGLVIHRAPLDTNCERSADSAADCTFESTAEPDGWIDASFNDDTWVTATTYSPDEVGAKDGYAQISWDPVAELIWTSSLTQDNTILWSYTIKGP
jgi:hypothetical protein